MPRGLLSYLIAIVVVALDQATKAWIVYGLDMTEGMSRMLFGPVRLTFIYNTGFSFGLMADAAWGRWILSGFSLIVSILLIVWARTVTDRRWLSVGIGLVLGGAVGNLIDRVLVGQVIDFVDCSDCLRAGDLSLFPWVFNVADASITFGVIALIYDQFVAPQPKAPRSGPAT